MAQGVGGTGDQIEEFLSAKGLTDAQIFGIVGNWQVESGSPSDGINSIKPTAYSIDTNGLPSGGIEQWNGGRLQAEQSYAKAQGKPWTDLQTQLNFFWAESNGQIPGDNQSGAFQYFLQHSGSVTDAATSFDQKVEVSSPASLPQRIAAATRAASAGGGSALLSTVNGIANPVQGGTDVVNGAVSAASSLFSWTTDLAKLIEWFADKNNLLRVGYFIGGGAMVLIGAAKLVGGPSAGSITSVAKLVK